MLLDCLFERAVTNSLQHMPSASPGIGQYSVHRFKA